MSTFKTFEYKGHTINMPQDTILFHGTPHDNRESILTHGLSPKFSRFGDTVVWLDADYPTAVVWGTWYEKNTTNTTVFAVMAKDLDTSKLELDLNNTDLFDEIIADLDELPLEYTSYTYSGVITPDKLYEITDQDFVEEAMT